MYSPAPPETPPPGSAADVPGPARYGYLLSRLRQRQITMEEATELFGIMQAMLRDSQTARARLERAPPAAPPKPSAAAPAAAAPSRAPVSDDLVLLGLLALGAGTGLGAAFAKKMTAPGPSGAAAAPRSTDPPARRPSRPS